VSSSVIYRNGYIFSAEMSGMFFGCGFVFQIQLVTGQMQRSDLNWLFFTGYVKKKDLKKGGFFRHCSTHKGQEK